MLGNQPRRIRKKLEEHGVRADAVVLEVGRRGMTVTHGNDAIVANTEVVLKLRLRVDPTSEPSFEVTTRLRFGQFALPTVGQRLAVVYDPDDHDHLMLDETAVTGTTLASGDDIDLRAILSGVRTAKAESGGDRQAMADLLRKQFGGTTMVLDGTGPAPAAEDPVELLVKLGDLRDRGLVSAEEFADQKRRILG